MKRIFKVLLISLFAVAFAVIVGYQIYKLPMNTDASCMMLEAQDILSGNIFLSGWSLTGVTFLTTDLPFYIVGVAIAGVSLNAFRIAVMLMFLAMTFCALLLALYNVKRKWLAVLIFIGVGLFPTTYALSNAFVHTAVFALSFLAIYVAARYNDKPSKSKLIILAVITALAVCGDSISLIMITLSLLVLCIFRSFKKSHHVACSVISGTAAGMVIQKLFLIIGGADLNSISHQEFINAADIWFNIGTYIEVFLKLINAYFFTKDLFSVKTLFFAIKIMVAVFVLYIIYSAVKAVVTKKTTDIPTATLGIGFGVISLILLLTTLNSNIICGRYITFLPLMLSIVISRYSDVSPVFKSPGVILGAIVLSVSLAATGMVSYRNQVSPYNTYSQMANFLQSENLTDGFSSFWDSSVITGYSNGNIRVRAVTYEDYVLKPYLWFCKKSWYDEPAQFIIVRNSGSPQEELDYNYNGIYNMRLDDCILYGVTLRNVEKSLGKPREIKKFKNYSILLYDKIELRKD